MSQAFIETMDLYFSEIKGESSKGINPENLEEIIKISKSQGVYYYVILALKRLYDENRLNLSEQDVKNIKTVLFNASTVNTNKLIMFSDVLKQFEENNILCCVLKGESLARFYFEPAFRISGDIDVLVSPENEEKAIEILRDNGFLVEARFWGTPHDVCYHPQMGRVELHITLYNDYVDEVWFDGAGSIVTEDKIKIESENGYPYYTLGVTDGFINDFLHGTKHFLNDGMGLRHISDILLYLKHYKNEIDFGKVYDLIDKLKYRKFLYTLIGVGILYCGFSKEDFPCAEFDQPICEAFLKEIEDFGIYGKERDGTGFNKRYTELKYSKTNQGGGSRYVLLKRIHNVLDYASLSKKNMEKRYRDKNIFVSRIKHIKSVFKLLTGRNYLKNEHDMYINREKLVEKLDMI